MSVLKDVIRMGAAISALGITMGSVPVAINLEGNSADEKERAQVEQRVFDACMEVGCELRNVPGYKKSVLAIYDEERQVMQMAVEGRKSSAFGRRYNKLARNHAEEMANRKISEIFPTAVVKTEEVTNEK